MNDIAYFAYLGKCTVCTDLRYNETAVYTTGQHVKVKKTRRREGGRAEGREDGKTGRRCLCGTEDRHLHGLIG